MFMTASSLSFSSQPDADLEKPTEDVVAEIN